MWCESERAQLMITIAKALIARSLFFIHSFLTIWRLYSVTSDLRHWALGLVLLLLFVETFYIIWKRKGHEWKWFSPCVLIYLLCVVPAIWMLEIDRLSRYKESTVYHNTTLRNQEESLSSIPGVNIPIKLSADMWALIIEQLLLLILILSRWILPRGEITRDQLSQLLFVYIGMASDIMELFYLFDEEAVIKDQSAGYVILMLWSISLTQFSMVLTVTKARKTRVAITLQEQRKKRREEDEEEANRKCSCLESDTWSIMTSICLQDAPFLMCRLVMMARFRIFTYSVLFFAGKNVLILMLQVYRLVSVNLEKSAKEDEEELLPNAYGNRRSRVNPALRPPVYLT